jgi:hypothetical protein
MSIVESEYANSLMAARRSASLWEARERRRVEAGNKAWGYYDASVEGYNYEFRNVLPKEGLGGLVRSFTRPVSVVEAFGSSTFIQKLAIQAKEKVGCGIALSLGDFRSDEEKERNREAGIIQIPMADIYTSMLWMNRVNNYLSDFGFKGADLVICRPVGGWEIRDDKGKDNLPDLVQTWTATQNLWKILGINGRMYIKYQYLKARMIDEWIESRLKRVGIGAKHEGDHSVEIIKTNISPKTIPAFTRGLVQ